MQKTIININTPKRKYDEFKKDAFTQEYQRLENEGYTSFNSVKLHQASYELNERKMREWASTQEYFDKWHGKASMSKKELKEFLLKYSEND